MTTASDVRGDAKTRVGVGTSRDRNAQRAGLEATRVALQQLQGCPANVVLLFATTGYDQQKLIDSVNEVAGGVPVVGCSAEGIIAHGQSDEDSHVVGAMAIASSNLQFSTYSVGNLGQDPSAAASHIAQGVAAVADPELDHLLILFPDGLNRGCSDLIESLDQQLPFPMVVSGGAAGAVYDTWKTYSYEGRKVLPDGVSAVLVQGRFEVDVGVSHGCEPMGLARIITDASNNLVRTIDGKPAWEVFKEYIDGNPTELTTGDHLYLSLGREIPIEHQKGYGELVVGAAAAHDKETGGLLFSVGFKTGMRVFVIRRDPERIFKSVVATAKVMHSRHPDRRPDLVLQFECCARGRILLGDKTTATVVEPLVQTLGTDVPWLGFHTYGEIAPLSGKTYYHNYTAAICAIYERP